MLTNFINHHLLESLPNKFILPSKLVNFTDHYTYYLLHVLDYDKINTYFIKNYNDSVLAQLYLLHLKENVYYVRTDVADKKQYNYLMVEDQLSFFKDQDITPNLKKELDHKISLYNILSTV